MKVNRYINQTVNKYILCLLIPVLDIILFFTSNIGGYWLYSALVVPIFHFCIVAVLCKNCEDNRKYNLFFLFSLLVLFGATILRECMWHLFLERSSDNDFVFYFKLVWIALCGLSFWGLSTISKVKNNKLNKLFFPIASLIILMVNSFTTYLLTPIFGNRLYGVELIFMPTTIMLLCVFSYYLGKGLTKQNITIKLFVWLIGILASEFITLYLLGTPHTPPTSHINSIILWVMVTSIVFCFCVIGLVSARRSERKKQ